jgi:excisionase family DNA binding protein
MNEHPPELLTVSQVARTLNISGQTVRNMCRSGKLFYTMVGTLFRISSASVDAILAGCNRVEPPKPRRMFPRPPNHIGR